MARGESNPTIESIRTESSDLSTGQRAQLLIDIKDNNPDSNEDWNAFWVEATSPQLDKPILGYCSIIQPGGSTTVDGSTADSPNYDGEFPITDPSMEINVRAGNFISGTECEFENYGSTHPVTDNSSLSLQVSGEETEPPQGQIQSVTTDNKYYSVGDDITIVSQIENVGGEGQITVEFACGTESDPFGGTRVQGTHFFAEGEVRTLDGVINVCPNCDEWTRASVRLPTQSETGQTKEIVIGLPPEEIRDRVSITIDEVLTNIQQATVKYTLSNPTNTEVDLTVELLPSNITDTFNLLPGEERQERAEFTFDNTGEITADLCINKKSVTIKR